MTTTSELHQRLEEISTKIDKARAEIDFKHGLSDGHHLTSGELTARYRYLTEKLKDDGVSTNSIDDHVSALEQDVWRWINGIDLALTS